MNLQVPDEIKSEVENGITYMVRKFEGDIKRSESMKKKGEGQSYNAAMREVWLQEKKQRLESLKSVLVQLSNQ